MTDHNRFSRGRPDVGLETDLAQRSAVPCSSLAAVGIECGVGRNAWNGEQLEETRECRVFATPERVKHRRKRALVVCKTARAHASRLTQDMSEFSGPVEGTAIEISTAKAIAARIAFRVGTITASARMVGIAGHLINTTETDHPSNKSLYMCGRVIQSSSPFRLAGCLFMTQSGHTARVERLPDRHQVDPRRDQPCTNTQLLLSIP
jgi:hypothetical protein